MCILIHHPINSKFSHEQLADFYSKNPDGFGAIVKRGDTVEVIKSIGTLPEIKALYDEQVSGHEAVIHFRMKTHGAIDIANCHPYEVIPGIWMAHNGVLSTGNAADPKMSDTWHYIQDFLKPVLEQDPSMIFNAGFQKMMADQIGRSNKFAFMNQEGEIAIINRTSGVDHGGIWYSNTYAWTPYRFGYGTPPAATTTKSYDGYWDRQSAFDYGYQGSTRKTYDHRYASSATWREWDKFDRESAKPAAAAQPKEGKGKRGRKKKAQQKPQIEKITTEQFKRLIRNSYNAVQLEGFQGALDWVSKHPMSAMRFIYEVYGSEHSAKYNANAISNMVNHDMGEAAELVCEIWEEMEPDLCDLADIQMTGVQL